MTRRVAEITLRVRVDVPDDYTDAEVAAIRRRLVHYDIRGGLYEVVSNAAHAADTERSIAQMSREVGIDIHQTFAVTD